MPEMKDPPEWLSLLFRILEKAVLVLAAILIPVALIAALLRGMKKAIQYYSAGEEDQITFLDSSDSETAGSKRRRKKPEESYWGETMRIRRKYRRVILKNSGQNPGGFETPEELEKKAGISIDELHRKYEKVRYK